VPACNVNELAVLLVLFMLCHPVFSLFLLRYLVLLPSLASSAPLLFLVVCGFRWEFEGFIPRALYFPC